MTDRHDAALRAALAERDRLRAQWQGHYTDNYVVTRIVEEALAAADAPEEPWRAFQCAHNHHELCQRDFGLVISPGEKTRPLAVCKCLCHGSDK